MFGSKQQPASNILLPGVALLTLLFIFWADIILSPRQAVAATARCPRYSVALTGQARMRGGVTYWARIEMYRQQAGGPGTYDGRWRVTRYDQGNVFRHHVRRTFTTTSRVNFGSGQWMICKSRVGGNRHLTSCTGGRFLFDVYRGRVGDRKQNRWVGRVIGNQMTIRFGAAPHEPPLRGVIARSPGKTKITLNILSPKNGRKVAFNHAKPGVLTIELIVKVTPAKYRDRIKWTIPVIKGSKRKITYPSGKKTYVKVTYTGLPAKNSAFGPKTIMAKVEAGGCRVSEKRRVKFFYPLIGRNNPGKKYPNWFYYWKQTPAARPSGQRVRIEYGGRTFDRCRSRIVPALFKPGFAYKTLHVCDLSKINFRLVYPLVNRKWPAKYHGTRTARYIDTFALAVIHEFFHWR